MSFSSASSVRHFRVQSGPVSLAVQSRGDTAQPCLIFIHGYPDTSAMWNAPDGLDAVSRSRSIT